MKARIEGICFEINRLKLVLSEGCDFFGSRKSEVQILSPRPAFAFERSKKRRLPRRKCRLHIIWINITPRWFVAYCDCRTEYRILEKIQSYKNCSPTDDYRQINLQKPGDRAKRNRGGQKHPCLLKARIH